MKKLLIPGILLVAIVMAPSCKKKKENTITADDAADAITEALEFKSGGFAEMVKAAAIYLENQDFGGGGDNLDCGESFDTTIAGSHNLVSVTSSFTHTWHYLLNCDGAVPVSISASGNNTGHYDGPRITSDTEGTRNWTITGLDAGSSGLIWNGMLTRTGVHTSKLRQKNTFTTTVDIVPNDVVVSKTWYKIVSGTATVAINCTSSDGKEYNYSGSLVFNGDNTATLTLNGHTYTITF
jgi:hypothetical protein